MKVLVINGSPRGEQSDCLKLTRAFLKGLGETAAYITAVAADVRPCRGCYACWGKGGACAIADDMPAILKQIVESDLVIFSFPLYCYGMPAPLKAIIDRVLPLSTRVQAVDADGRTYHPSKRQNTTRFMLISGCGFPNLTHNYEGVRFQFGMMFGQDFPYITCAEAPLLSIPEAKPLADGYLALCESAGREFARDGRIAPETQARLDTPMFDPDTYRKMASGG